MYCKSQLDDVVLTGYTCEVLTQDVCFTTVFIHSHSVAPFGRPHPIFNFPFWVSFNPLSKVNSDVLLAYLRTVDICSYTSHIASNSLRFAGIIFPLSASSTFTELLTVGVRPPGLQICFYASNGENATQT